MSLQTINIKHLQDLNLLSESKQVILAEYYCPLGWKKLIAQVSLHYNDNYADVNYRVESSTPSGCLSLILDSAVECYNSIKFEIFMIQVNSMDKAIDEATWGSYGRKEMIDTNLSIVKLKDCSSDHLRNILKYSIASVTGDYEIIIKEILRRRGERS